MKCIYCKSENVELSKKPNKLTIFGNKFIVYIAKISCFDCKEQVELMVVEDSKTEMIGKQGSAWEKFE